ncbi:MULTISPECIES: type II secretion system F family protein [unclassified Geodermatophilus]|uniref:type II secretion system F family protein n=1 Tax=unclassified Geodermatophilus TaxID=2637632 RepID=UPI003EE93E0A
MSGHAAALLLAAAVLVWPPRRTLVLRRVRRLSVPQVAEAGPPAGGADVGPRRRWALAGTAGVATGLLVGGLLGAVTAAVVAAGIERLLRRGGDERSAGVGSSADLPVACDLLAVCLRAGMPVGGAVAAVASVLPGAPGPALATVAALYRMGAPPSRAWSDVPADLDGLGRVLVRAGESGSAVVPAVQALAADLRAEARSRADAAVRRAGVWVLAPLGACFLPAFLCLGVVPLVLGIAADVFG